VTQTWVPTTSHAATARVLLGRHLGAQRGEALIVLRALTDEEASGGWARHPAVRMWRGHHGALCEYGVVVCREWRARGYQDACLGQFLAALDDSSESSRTLPAWWGVHEVHRSHRRALVARFPWHYGRVWPEERPGEVAWPDTTDGEDDGDARVLVAVGREW
jgi:hypothetical protein